MLKKIRPLMLVCALASFGGINQNIGEQNIGQWKRAAQGIAGSGDQNI